MQKLILAVSALALAGCSANDANDTDTQEAPVESAADAAGVDDEAAPTVSDGYSDSASADPATGDDSPIGRTEAQLGRVDDMNAQTAAKIKETEAKLDEADKKAAEIQRMIDEKRKEQGQ